MSDEEIIYHYTNVDAAFNILISGEIWLSDAKKMNDYTEIETCLNLLKNLIPSYPQIETLIPIQIATQFMDRMDYYLCSFTSKKDALSQWFRYGQDGAGIALGFSFSNDSLGRNYHSPYLNGLNDLKIQALPVDYVDPKGDTKTLFNFLFEYLHDAGNWELGMSVIDTIFKQSMRWKHIGFEEEGEVRIGCFAPRTLDTNVLVGYGRCNLAENLCNLPLSQRSTGTDIVRYIPLPIKKDGIQLKRIVKGPNCLVDDEDIRFILKKSLNIEKMEIISSLTPYRP